MMQIVMWGKNTPYSYDDMEKDLKQKEITISKTNACSLYQQSSSVSYENAETKIFSIQQKPNKKNKT